MGLPTTGRLSLSTCALGPLLQGGDVTAPLRSSLAGLRLGEPGAHAANAANRAFSHADLHSLSGAYGDLNPYASNPDLASLVSGNPTCTAVCTC